MNNMYVLKYLLKNCIYLSKIEKKRRYYLKIVRNNKCTNKFKNKIILLKLEIYKIKACVS